MNLFCAYVEGMVTVPKLENGDLFDTIDHQLLAVRSVQDVPQSNPSIVFVYVNPLLSKYSLSTLYGPSRIRSLILVVPSSFKNSG